LIEVRGVGLRRIAHEPSAVVGLVVDLAAAEAQRLPDDGERIADVGGIKLPRLAVASGAAALPALLARINSPANSWI
jgi:HPr kinase/phosphorylase